MDMISYQLESKKTAIYPDHGTGCINALAYCTLGLCGEAGEVANKIKKLMRDEDTLALRLKITQEMGDVLWYLAQLATEMDVTLDVIATQNLGILRERAEKNKLHGEGDDRQLTQ